MDTRENSETPWQPLPDELEDDHLQLSGRLGNDVNNALMAIQIQIELLRRRFPDNDRVRDAAGVILSAVQSAAVVIREIRADLETLAVTSRESSPPAG